MTKIANNITFLRNQRGFTQEELAQELNISRSRIGSYEEARSEPSIETLISISECFNLPIDVLVKHDLSKSNNKSFIDIGNQRVLFPIVINQDDEDMVEVISAKASAGYLNGYADPEFIEQLDKIKLPFLPTGKHRAFPIKGDSMLPLKSGSYVVGRFLENFSEHVDGKTYVLLTVNEGIIYKRVYEKDNSTLLIKSDNRLYQPYEIKKSEVLEMWEFTCSIHMEDYEEEELKVDGVLRMLREMQVELESLRK